MTQTFTQEHRAKLEEYLATHTLPSGLGTEESACSIAAINLSYIWHTHRRHSRLHV
jgi:hypothetical protein